MRSTRQINEILLAVLLELSLAECLLGSLFHFLVNLLLCILDVSSEGRVVVHVLVVLWLKEARPRLVPCLHRRLPLGEFSLAAVEGTVTRHGVIDSRPISFSGISVYARKTDLRSDAQRRLAVSGVPAASDVDALFTDSLVGELGLLNRGDLMQLFLEPLLANRPLRRDFSAQKQL